jgi:carboxyl-terminal processing protease
MAKGRMVYEAAMVGILGVAVFGSTLALVRKGSLDGGDYAFLDPVIDVKNAITGTYVNEITPDLLKKMQEGAIKGMIDALDDPYTVYVPPAETTGFEKDLTGEYSGIGASVQISTDGYLQIVSPLEDSPAFRMGIMAEDKVVEIEGKPTLGLTVDQCIDLLMGKAGTEVSIVIDRKGTKIPMKVVREKIKTRSIKGVHRDAADGQQWKFLVDEKRGIAYVRIVQFTPGVTREFASALMAAGAAEGKVKGLVIDLRWNPGGLLTEAIALADLFLEDGVIVSTKGRKFPERVEKARKEGTLPNFPIAVLINGQSASASEILAGALTENNRAVAVGTRTYGKGSVQGVRGVSVKEPDGTEKEAELKITEQGYYLPSGRSITRKNDSTEWGVDPSKGFYVDMSDEELIAMLKVRRDQEILRAEKAGEKPAPDAAKDAKAPETPRWADPEWVLDFFKDPQLAAAVRGMQAKLDSGEWKKTGGEAGAIAAQVGSELAKLHTARDRLTRELIRIEKRSEALEKGASVEAAAQGRDLWPDSVDLTGGKMQIFDKDGKLVATLDITSNTLERWLVDADVKKSKDEAAK